MEKYYSKRAQEYEKIYYRDDPVRQKEQIEIANSIKELSLGRNVLEIACGTGYWTEKLAQVANKVVATDLSNETLEIAKQKNMPINKVAIVQCDAYKLNEIEGNFDLGCALFWFSHIPKSRIDEFLESFHQTLGKGARVFMADNIYLEGVGGELILKEGEEDTYKIRKLADGTEYEVIKNYYSEEDLKRIFEKKSIGLNVYMGKCFWWIEYFVK